MVVVDNLRTSKAAFNQWVHLIAQAHITVSIDCYSLGILFFRQEQVKEHFTIRL